MRILFRELAVGCGVAAAMTGVVWLLGLSPWSPGAAITSVPVFLAALFLVGLTATLDRPSPPERRETVRLAFVGELLVLFFYGPLPMTITAAAAVIASALARPVRSGELRQLLADAPTVIIASLISGYSYTAIASGTIPLTSFVVTWPGRTLPITFALVLYALLARVIGRAADAFIADRSPGTLSCAIRSASRRRT